MKRYILSLVCLGAASLALAQAPFTIVRPADGSRVRETVRIQIPRNSIPSGGYVGIFVGGKFVEALVPPLRGQFYEYALDTKGRNLPDGKVNLEVVLYVDFNDQPRIVDRSSVEVTIANRANIPVPENGLQLRYRWRPGTELVYVMEQRMSISAITEAQARLGGRAAELPIEGETVRLLYAVDNAYGNGDGLLRLQALPLKGKDYAILTTTESTEPKKYMDFQMHPVYMRVSSTGNEVFGSIPRYFPLEGTAAESFRTDLFAVMPLPTLPARPVRPGDAWAGRFLWSDYDLEKVPETNSVSKPFPARGELLGLEWEMGFPCAKIRYSIAEGTTSEEGMKLRAMGSDFSDDKVSLEETVWFALDRGIVVKVVRDMTIDRRQTTQAAAGGPGAGGPSGGPAGPTGVTGAGGGGGGQATGVDRQGRRGPPQAGGAGGRTGADDLSGGPSTPGVPGAPGGRGTMGGQQQAQTQFLRYRIQMTMTLER
jgi:hypothetical protein